MKNPSLISAPSSVDGGVSHDAARHTPLDKPGRAGAHHEEGDLGDGGENGPTRPVMMEQFGPVAWWNNRCEMQNGSRDKSREEKI